MMLYMEMTVCWTAASCDTLCDVTVITVADRAVPPSLLAMFVGRPDQMHVVCTYTQTADFIPHHQLILDTMGAHSKNQVWQWQSCVV